LKYTKDNICKITVIFATTIALLLAAPISVVAGSTAGSCYNSQNGQPPFAAACDCDAMRSVLPTGYCYGHTDHYVSNTYTQCNGGSDQGGSANCKDSPQAEGYYFHCDTDPNWSMILAALGLPGAVCAIVCAITLGTGCIACIVAVILANEGATLFTCAMVSCTVKQDGVWKDNANPNLTGECPTPA